MSAHTESARGGGSQETPSKPVPLILTVVMVVITMAILAGVQTRQQQVIEHVPLSWAPPHICVPNGPVVDVTRFVDNPYVLTVHCAVNNITMTAATPAGH